METKGKIYSPQNMIVMEASKRNVKDKLFKFMKDGKRVEVTITFSANITKMEPGGKVVFGSTSAGDVTVATWYKKRSITQINTLKALEAFIFWAQEGIYPQKSVMLWAIHEAILESADLRDPETGARIRVSSPVCTTQHMNLFIEEAMRILADSPIDKDLKDLLFTDKPLSELFSMWIQQRMVCDDIAQITSYAEFAQRFPYCMATFQQAPDLQIAHIISRGSRPDLADKPWNWIRLRSDLHSLQHQKGWDEVIKAYGHLGPIVRNALNLAKKIEPKEEI